MNEYTYLAHHGIKGMRWGVRNFQNEDGSLTPMGRMRYELGEARKKLHTDTVIAKSKMMRAGGKVDTRLRKLGRASASIHDSAKEAAVSIGSKLGFQRAESARLRKYISEGKWERTVSATLKSAKLQKDWARRKEAGKKYVDRLEIALYNISQASESRHYARTTYLNRAMKKFEGSSSSEDRDYWLQTYRDRMIPSSKYVSNKEAAANWKIARGH